MENDKFYNLTPSVGGSFGFAWRKIFGKAFLMLLVTVIIMWLLNGPSTGFKWEMDRSWHVPFVLFPAIVFGLAYALLFLPVIRYGKRYLFLQAMRDEDLELKTIFEGFTRQYLNIVLANLIVTALVMIGFALLFIPGIIAICRLIFVPYLVMDKNMEAMAAVEKSWHMTRGHGWSVLGMGIVSFFVFIAGLMAFGVGVIISGMWVSAAFATLYQSVLNLTDDENPIPILGVNEA